MKAYCLIRSQPHYRLDAFQRGLEAAGYALQKREPSVGAPGDVLVIWNRYGTHEQIADRFEKDGGTVLVAENGYVGRDGEGRQYYAIARHGHNGSGSWHAGGPERWERLAVRCAPWRESGSHILVCPNRAFGMRGFEMPVHWANETASALRRFTKRPIRVRPHPGNWQKNAPLVPLAEDLKNAWAVVVWASSAGVHALISGIPVIALAPYWILRAAAGDRLDQVEGPPLFDRAGPFEKLAWAQWTVNEIESGEPFRRLCADQAHHQVRAACAG